MDNIRVILFGALFAVMFLIWQAWQQDYGQGRDLAEQRAAQEAALIDPDAYDDSDIPQLPAEMPEAEDSDLPAVPAAEGEPVEPVVESPTDVKAGAVRVITDVLDLKIDLQGGSLVRAALLDYPVTLENPDEKLTLLNRIPQRYLVVEGGLIARDADTPTHRAVWQSERAEYRAGAGELRVPLRWAGANGVQVTKTYVFNAGSYQIGVEYQINNASGADYKVSQYQQLIRTGIAPEGDTPFMQTYFGAALYEAKDDGGYRYREIEFDDLEDEPVNVRQQGGWTGMVQHYFLAAILPPEDSTQVFAAAPQKHAPGRYMVRSTSIPVTVPAGGETTLASRLYVGPKLQDNLKDIAPGLELTVDYSWLSFLAKPLFWLLSWLHGVFGNWGIAIILITVAVKAAFYKLSEAQYRSMAKMKVFAPRIKKLRERYSDDREKMQQAMMKLYKEEKFNPLGGCWPLLVQIPVFIALYWVLLESVELRHAPFMLWIDDLSAKDPYFVMPLLLGAAMWFQQKLSNQAMTMDPMQAKIMQFMPVMMTVFFAFFPAGLVLYWFFNTLLGMLQQWYITRKIDAQAKS